MIRAIVRTRESQILDLTINTKRLAHGLYGSITQKLLPLIPPGRITQD